MPKQQYISPYSQVLCRFYHGSKSAQSIQYAASHEQKQFNKYSLAIKRFLAGVASDVLRMRLRKAIDKRKDTLATFLQQNEVSIVSALGQLKGLIILVYPPNNFAPDLKKWSPRLLCIVLRASNCLTVREQDDVIYLEKIFRRHFGTKPSSAFGASRISRPGTMVKRQWVKVCGAVQRFVETLGDGELITAVRNFICKVEMESKPTEEQKQTTVKVQELIAELVTTNDAEKKDTETVDDKKEPLFHKKDLADILKLKQEFGTLSASKTNRPTSARARLTTDKGTRKFKETHKTNTTRADRKERPKSARLVGWPQKENPHVLKPRPASAIQDSKPSTNVSKQHPEPADVKNIKVVVVPGKDKLSATLPLPQHKPKTGRSKLKRKRSWQSKSPKAGKPIVRSASTTTVKNGGILKPKDPIKRALEIPFANVGDGCITVDVEEPTKTQSKRKVTIVNSSAKYAVDTDENKGRPKSVGVRSYWRRKSPSRVEQNLEDKKPGRSAIAGAAKTNTAFGKPKSQTTGGFLSPGRGKVAPMKRPDSTRIRDEAKNSRTEEKKPTTSTSTIDREKGKGNAHEDSMKKIANDVLVHQHVHAAARDPMFKDKHFIDEFFSFLRENHVTKKFLKVHNAEPHKTWKLPDGTKVNFSFFQAFIFRHIGYHDKDAESSLHMVSKMLNRMRCRHPPRNKSINADDHPDNKVTPRNKSNNADHHPDNTVTLVEGLVQEVSQHSPLQQAVNNAMRKAKGQSLEHRSSPVQNTRIGSPRGKISRARSASPRYLGSTRENTTIASREKRPSTVGSVRTNNARLDAEALDRPPRLQRDVSIAEGQCWKCNQKELSMTICVNWRNTAICRLLLADGIAFKEEHLVPSVKANDLETVKEIVGYLKRTKAWHPEDDNVKAALYTARKLGVDKVVAFLEQEGAKDDRSVKISTCNACKIT